MNFRLSINKHSKVILFLVLIVFVSCSTTSFKEKEVEQYLVSAIEHTNQKEYQKALDIYNTALEKFPLNEKLLYNKGLTEFLNGDNLRALETLIKLDSLVGHSNTNYLKAIAEIALLEKQKALAIGSYYKIVSNNLEDYSYRRTLIELLEEEKMYDEAYLVAKEAFDLQLFSKELLLKLSELEVRTKKGDGLSYLLLVDNYY